MGWRMCIDYRKLNKPTKKDHFPLPFIDEMLEWLANHFFFCFLDGYSSYHQIPIHPDDQSKTTFKCPYGTYAYCRMSFGSCNAPASFQRCMMSIFSDMIEEKPLIFVLRILILERCGSVTKPERHPPISIGSVWASKCGLALIIRVDGNLVITRIPIKETEAWPTALTFHQ